MQICALLWLALNVDSAEGGDILQTAIVGRSLTLFRVCSLLFCVCKVEKRRWKTSRLLLLWLLTCKSASHTSVFTP